MHGLPVRYRAATRLVALLTTLAYAGVANAEGTGLSGFNNLFFRPATGEGLYSLHASTTLPPRLTALGVHLHLGRRMTSVVMPARAMAIDLIDTNVTADLHAAVGITKYLELGLNLPIVWLQHGTNFDSLQSYTTMALGDVRLDAKLRLLPDRPRSIGLALLSSATLPSGNRGAFTGDRGPTWEGRVIVDKTWPVVGMVANVGYRVVPATTVLTTLDDDRLTFGGGVQIPLPIADRSWRIVTEVAGETVLAQRAEASTPVEVRAGVRKVLASGLVFDLGAGIGVTNAYGVPAYRVLIGFSFNGARRQEARERQRLARQRMPINYTVYFPLGRATIHPDDHAPLRVIGQQLAVDGTRRVVLDGYTDRSGPRAVNQRLSRARVARVCQYLGYFGADHGQCIPHPHGEVPQGRKRWSPTDRRVDIREP